MTDERPPRPPRRPLPSLRDDEVVEVDETPPIPLGGRYVPPQTPADMMREMRDTQRKMALQLDGFGQAMNRRFDIFHEELAMLRSTVTADHAPRIGKVEATLGQKAARGGGIVAAVLLVAPLLAEALPKYRSVIEAIAGAFQ